LSGTLSDFSELGCSDCIEDADTDDCTIDEGKGICVGVDCCSDACGTEQAAQ